MHGSSYSFFFPSLVFFWGWGGNHFWAATVEIRMWSFLWKNVTETAHESKLVFRACMDCWQCLTNSVCQIILHQWYQMYPASFHLHCFRICCGCCLQLWSIWPWPLSVLSPFLMWRNMWAVFHCPLMVYCWWVAGGTYRLLRALNHSEGCVRKF